MKKRLVNALMTLVVLMLLLDAFSLINIAVSKKYEVDLLSTHYKIHNINRNKLLNEREQELNNDKLNTEYRIVSYMLFITGIILYHAFHKKKNE